MIGTPENRNARPWNKYGYSAPTLEIAIKWVELRFGIETTSESEIIKAIEEL